MRRKLKIALIALGCLVAALIVIPPIEYALAEQPSCFAFIGMKPPKSSPEREQAELAVKKAAFEARQKALSQDAIQPPRPPYVIVTRVSDFGDGTAVNILVAQEEGTPPSVGKKERFWRIYEANQAFDNSKNVPSADFTAQPTRVLFRSELSRLVRKRCLFNEPAVTSFPKAWLSTFDPWPKYYHGGYRLIEINDGKRSGYFRQASRPLGITGAIGQHLVRNAIGFSYPSFRDGNPPFRDSETQD